MQAAEMRDQNGGTVLHCATMTGNLESIKVLVALYPISQHMQVVCMQDEDQRTVLRCAASSGNAASINFTLGLLTEDQCRQAVSTRDRNGMTPVHYAARSGDLESIRAIVAIYPESQHLEIVCMGDIGGCKLGQLGSNCIYSRNSATGRALTSRKQARFEWKNCSALCCSINFDSVRDILGSLSESERTQVVSIVEPNEATLSHYSASSGNTESIKYTLALYPESQHLQIMNTRDSNGMTPLHWALSCVSIHGLGMHARH